MQIILNSLQRYVNTTIFYVGHIIVFPNIVLRVGLQGIVNINKLSLVCNHLKNIRRISTFRAKVDPYISVSGSCIPTNESLLII